MPLQLERRGQSVYTFIQQLHHAIVAAIDIDFANPDRTRRFNLHRSIGCSNRGAAHPSKTFPHALKKPCPIIVPLVPVIVANEIGNSFPISAIDRVKKMFCVEADLMLRPPEPEQVYAHRNKQRRSANECSTECNRHITIVADRAGAVRTSCRTKFFTAIGRGRKTCLCFGLLTKGNPV